MKANLVKFRYLILLVLLLIWVYVVPLKFGSIDELGFANSNEYYTSGANNDRPRLISFSTIERNKYLDTLPTLRLAIEYNK